MVLQNRYINKNDILSNVNDVTIYNTYLETPIVIGQRIPSPFRRDSNPSFGFFNGQSEVCWKDFSTGETGDCFEFVKRLYPNFTFFDTLSKIATDLDLPKDQGYFYKDMSEMKTKIFELSDEERKLLIAKANSNLQVKFRAWCKEDADFWMPRGVDYPTLQFYNVFPISHIFINENIIAADQLAYCFIENKDGQQTYKIYQPFNTKGLKWLSSHDSSVWQGWSQLPPKGLEVIITKSLKDVMALATTLKIPAISLQSENTKPKQSVIEELQSRFKVIYVLYDNDFDKDVNVGRMMGKKLVEDMGCGVQVELPEKYGAKDYSDLILKVGRVEAEMIMSNQILIPF